MLLLKVSGCDSSFEFTHVWPAARPPDSNIANSRFCRVFNDVGFEWLQKLNPLILIYATRALSGRLLFHAR